MKEEQGAYKREGERTKNNLNIITIFLHLALALTYLIVMKSLTYILISTYWCLYRSVLSPGVHQWGMKMVLTELMVVSVAHGGKYEL